MFSKENRRFTTLVIALVIVVLATINGVGRTIAADHAKDAYIVGGVSAVVILQFLGMIRAEQERREAKQSRNEIADKVESIEKKTNGNLNTAIKTVAEEVKKAASMPAPGQEQMPRTPQELQSLIKLFLREMSEELIHRATTEATIKATKDAVELATRTAARAVIEELKSAGYRIERPA